jgi:hypothetical protein
MSKERLIKIEAFDSDTHLIDSWILPFKGFQWINTEFEHSTKNIKFRADSFKVTIFEATTE